MTMSIVDKKLRSDDIANENCIRTGLSREDIQQSFIDSLYYDVGKISEGATLSDFYMALAYAIRSRVLKKGVRTVEHLCDQDVRLVSYLAAPGRKH